MQLKDLVGCKIVGSGSDFIVVEKEKKKRILVQFSSSVGFKELRNAGTPYGSQID
jgi:hypothetical protein